MPPPARTHREKELNTPLYTCMIPTELIDKIMNFYNDGKYRQATKRAAVLDILEMWLATHPNNTNKL